MRLSLYQTGTSRKYAKGPIMIETYKSKSDSKTYYPFTDIARLFCAFLVVMIHCVEVPESHPIGDFIVKCFSSQAVPFFMIVSGYFSVDRLAQKNTKEIIRSCLKSWIFLYVAWSLLWLPYYIHLYGMKYSNASIAYLAAAIARRYLFAGQGVYWYLLVLAEAAFISAILIQKKQEPVLAVLAIAGLLSCILYDANIAVPGITSFNHAIYLVFSWSNNFLMKGIPYVAAGYFIKKYSTQKRITVRACAIVYAASTAGMIALYATGRTNWLCLYPLQAVSLFLMSLNTSSSVISKKFSRFCRNASSAIYFLHTVFMYGIIDVIWGANLNAGLKFLIAVTLSLVVYGIIQKMHFEPGAWLLGVRQKR